MKVVITGATGMVGKGVLLECLDSREVEEVLSISRRPLDIKNSKLIELIHKDFSDFHNVTFQLQGYDACFHCMGVSAAGMNEMDYSVMTFGYTHELAKTFLKANPGSAFVYVSGQGTDSSEKGRAMWARVKGKTENTLLNMGFKNAYMYRPGVIIPKRGVKPSSKVYQKFMKYASWIFPVAKFLAPKSVVDSSQIGQSMIKIISKGYSKNIISPSDILALSKN